MQILQQLTYQHILYLLLLVSCCYLSISTHLSNPALKIFRSIFTIALLVEITVTVITIYKPQFPIFAIYHLYIPIEYCLLTLFFYKNIDQIHVRKLAQYSIAGFIILSLFLSQFYIGWTNFPGLNLNLEGILLCSWAVIVLFSVKPHLDLPIFRLPIFWICLAIIIYHSGTFVMNGLFNVLRQSRYELFQSLREVVSKNINNLLYIMFIIAFLCSHQMKKYS